MSPAHDVKLAALMVNYNTGSYALCCVESLIHEWEREGRSRDKLTIICIDNASPMEQEPHLTHMEELGVEVIRSDENHGYAKGMNLCYERTSGDPGDAVALLNPDLHFLPGTIRTLIDYIYDNPECGTIDPYACIDPLGVFNLPRNLLPTPAEHWRVTLAQMSPFFCRMYSRYRLKHSMQWWTSPEPIKTNMLSGCCLFLRREVVEKMGQPMDPRYPLYFEDTDLFRTLSGLGYTVVHHTGARILHHWSRSAKTGGEGETYRRYEASRIQYYQKFYGPLGRLAFGVMNAIAKRWPQKWLGRPMMKLQNLGEFTEPVEIPLPYRCRFLLEIAIHPTFIICAGIFGEGDRWVCPPESWEWLFKLEFYIRGVDLDTGKELGCWRFTKVNDEREHAMRQVELDSYGERLLSMARTA